MSWKEFRAGKYVEIKKGEFHCRDCDAIIMAEDHYGFGADEHGFMYHEQILLSQTPFCPKCDGLPSRAAS